MRNHLSKIARVNVEPLERRTLFAAGDLDPTFGNGGIASFDYRDKDYGTDVVAQADGKVVVVASSGADRSDEWDFVLARFNADGSRDTTFGDGGLAVTDFGGYDVPRAAAQLPDGSILVVGSSRLSTRGASDRWAVARYTADGDPDPRFSGDGLDLLDVRGSAEAVVVQPDGKPVLAGTSEYHHFGVARYNANGTLDASFGAGGFVTTRFNQGISAAYVVGVGPDGRIVAAGTYSGGGPAGGVAARYLPDGSLDPSFDKDGRDFLVGGQPWPRGIHVQADHKIVLFEDDLTFRRLRARGGLDTTFGEGGFARLPLSAPGERQHSVDFLARPDGRYLVSGFPHFGGGVPDTSRTVLARVLPDGRLDPTFGGGDGFVALPAYRDGMSRTFGRLALAPDGKIVAAGTDTRPGPVEFDSLNDATAYRFEGDGPVEPPPGGDVTVQAESGGPFAGAFVSRSNAGYTGGGYLDFSADSGGSAAWNVAGLDGPGDYVVDFRYANGSSSRTLQFEATPGTPAKNVAFPSTGAWTNWSTVSIPATVGGAGNSLAVVLRTIGQNGPNIDSLTVRKTGTTPPTGATFQAEQATVVGAQVASNTQGYTGTGFVDFLHGTGDSVEWSFNHAGGRRTLSFRYANGSTADRPLELRINGQVINPRLSFAPTGDWSTWREVSVTVDLAAGNNRVKLTSIGNNGANIDVLNVG